MYHEEKLESLEVTLSIGCKLDCKFCPQEIIKNEYIKKSCNKAKFLSFDDFKKCISKVAKGMLITFSGMSEPFLNPECSKMLKYAFDKGYKITLFTTLMGMNDEDYEIIKKIDFDHLIIHIPDEENNSKFVITNHYLNLLKKISMEKHIDYYSCHGHVHNKIKNIINKNIEIYSDMIDRAGNLKVEGVNTSNNKGKIICMVGSAIDCGAWQPELLPDGSLILCPMDYGMKHVLGNLITEDWNQIKNGNEFSKILNGWQDDSIDILCRKCYAAKNVELIWASRFKRALDVLRKKDDEVYFDSLGGKVSDNTLNIMKKIINAKNICIFGVGKLFKDKYYKHLWNKAINANIYSDNNFNVKSMEIDDMKFVIPSDLSKYEGLLVITFVREPSEINNQLKSYGINNYINIYDIEFFE